MVSATTFPGGLRARRAFDTACVVLALLLIWQGMYEVIGSIALTPPWATIVNAVNLMLADDFWPGVRSSLTALAIAMVIEISLGLVLGVIFGLNRLLGETVEPVLAAFYSVPKIVFYPVILMFFGLGIFSQVIFGVFHGIFPIMLFTMNAVRNVKPVYLKAARVMRLGRLSLMFGIAIPSTIPEIFTGLRFGFSSTLLGVLFSEMFGSKIGYGYLLMNAIGLNQAGRIMALTLNLAAFAIATNLILLAIDRHLHKRL